MANTPIPGGGALRPLKPGTCAQLRIIDLATGEDRQILQSATMLEAPNWAPDGKALYVNGQGQIARLDLTDAPKLDWITIEGVDTANNDHLISADGQTLYISSDGAVYAVAAQGGLPTRLTPEGSIRYYLHGISPDGTQLACAAINAGDPAHKWGIRLVPATGGTGDVLVAGTEPVDGPEWTADGAWIWFNGELGAAVSGHARLFRIRPDGSGLQQMTDGDGVDWFPHNSPDGAQIAFVRYPPGTQGHPADLPVSLHLMPAEGGEARMLVSLHGGQGTINVNSWSPDSRYLAYMAYPEATEA